MKDTASERLRAFRARNRQYQELGYDREAAFRSLVREARPLEGPALDVGTGKGLLARELARLGMDVVSVDISSDERELACLLAQESDVAGRVVFAQADAARLPYPDGHFGCAAMMDVLHHLEEPGPVLSEMVRVVRPGGRLLLADFDEAGFELVARISRQEGREHLRSATTVTLAREILTRAGLRCLMKTNGHHHEMVVLQKVRSEDRHGEGDQT